MTPKARWLPFGPAPIRDYHLAPLPSDTFVGVFQDHNTTRWAWTMTAGGRRNMTGYAFKTIAEAQAAAQDAARGWFIDVNRADAAEMLP